MTRIHSGDHGLNLEESDDSSRLVRYLIKKGTNVDSSIQWKNIDHDRSEKTDADDRRGAPQCSIEISSAIFPDMLASESNKLDRSMNSFSSYLSIREDNPSHHSQSQVEHSLYYSAETVHGDLHSFSRRRKSSSNLASIAAHDQTSQSSSYLSIKSLGSLSSYSSLPRSRSLSLSTYNASKVTVLLLDIQGFTAECTSLPAARVGEWVAAFYSRVDKVAVAHGVQKVAVRGDCCICVAGLEGSVPIPVSKALQAPDLRSDQATRMLAFATALHCSLATITAGGVRASAGSASTETRMGVATGDVTFLVNSAAAAEAAPCASVWGDAVDIAAQMEAKAAPGKVYVHRSTADRWAAEVGRPPPHSLLVECEGRGQQRAAVYDCVAQDFLPAPAAASPLFEGSRRTREEVLRQRASAFF